MISGVLFSNPARGKWLNHMSNPWDLGEQTNAVGAFAKFTLYVSGFESSNIAFAIPECRTLWSQNVWEIVTNHCSSTVHWSHGRLLLRLPWEGGGLGGSCAVKAVDGNTIHASWLWDGFDQFSCLMKSRKACVQCLFSLSLAFWVKWIPGCGKWPGRLGHRLGLATELSRLETWAATTGFFSQLRMQ